MSNQTEDRKARVFLVDDHPLVREHLTALIRHEADLEVCGEAADAPTALSLIGLQAADLVILDISLKRSSGLDAYCCCTDRTNPLTAKKITPFLDFTSMATASL